MRLRPQANKLTVPPPQVSAVPSPDKGDSRPQSPRNRHIQLMAERGRMGWQQATGYCRRNQVETAMARYKHLIGPKLRAQSLPAQQGEGRYRRRRAEHDYTNGKARLRPRRLISA